MNRLVLFAVLLLTSACSAQPSHFLDLPQTPRVLGMGGGFVSVTDGPEAGFLNPSGLRLLKQAGYDVFYGSTSRVGPDQLGFALSNPGGQHGAAFAMGFWSQGWTERRRPTYYVPYTGTSFDLTSSTHLGLVMRFPYVTSTDSAVSSGWRTLGDVSVLQTFESVRVAAAVERAFGGGANIIPRKLRAGSSFLSASSGIVVAYEWQGDQTRKSFNFMRSSSHYGAEVPIGKFALIRGGYISGAQHRVAMGVAIGTMSAGWRIEGGWELPAAVRGETRWVIGMGYCI